MPQRERITITIRQDLLRRLDQTIDHQRVRNRSHAFEVMISRLFESETKQAVILASGEGVSLRPFTYEIPKPLIPVNGRPLLEYSIDLLRQHEITSIVITVSHLADKIKQHFGDGSAFGVRITYVEENKPSGTAGALAAARSALHNSPFLMLYGDVLLDLDLNEFLQAHSQQKAALGTLALTSVADPSAFGAVKMRGNRIVQFSEKPEVSRDVSRLVFAGLAGFSPSVFEFFPSRPKGKLSLEKDIFPRLIQEGRLYGYPFEGQWFDVSTPESYDSALKGWSQKS
jgi:mannose-1-phosphate guanylyltransferase / phosphomannomutase